MWFRPPQSKILTTPINWRLPEKLFSRPFFLESTCGCVFGFWPWPRHSSPWPRERLSSVRLSLASDFFVSLASSLVSSTPPLSKLLKAIFQAQQNHAREQSTHSLYFKHQLTATQPHLNVRSRTFKLNSKTTSSSIKRKRVRVRDPSSRHSCTNGDVGPNHVIILILNNISIKIAISKHKPILNIVIKLETEDSHRHVQKIHCIYKTNLQIARSKPNLHSYRGKTAVKYGTV